MNADSPKRHTEFQELWQSVRPGLAPWIKLAHFPAAWALCEMAAWKLFLEIDARKRDRVNKRVIFVKGKAS